MCACDSPRNISPDETDYPYSDARPACRILYALSTQYHFTMKGGYVDGFVMPVPKGKTAAYKKMAEWGAATWMKCGALAYFECAGDDLKTKSSGGMTPRSFKDIAGATATDNVWFSFIVFRDKKHRDAVNKKVMAVMAKESKEWEGKPMPFDPNKMAYGGFKTIVMR